MLTAEPTDGKESWITFAYSAETATRSFANYVQEWKEYDIYVNSTVAKTTRPFDAEAKPNKENNYTAKTNLATTCKLNQESLIVQSFIE